jgi:hypothetical protein
MHIIIKNDWSPVAGKITSMPLGWANPRSNCFRPSPHLLPLLSTSWGCCRARSHNYRCRSEGLLVVKATLVQTVGDSDGDARNAGDLVWIDGLYSKINTVVWLEEGVAWHQFRDANKLWDCLNNGFGFPAIYPEFYVANEISFSYIILIIGIIMILVIILIRKLCIIHPG